MAKGKRGISPVVATALLIAMVVIIALILFLWFRGMHKEAVTKFGENVELTCSDVKLDASYTGDSLTITNIGNIPIYNLKMKIEKKGGHETKDIKQDYGTAGWPSTGLNQGDVATLNINLGADVKKIVLIPVLIGNSETGKKTHTCNEKDGFEIEL